VPGEPIDIGSIKPMTGFYRDVRRNSAREDLGVALAHCSLFNLTHFAPGVT